MSTSHLSPRDQRTLTGARRSVRKARVASFKLPTLAQFKRFSLRRRTEVFLAWVKTKRGSYSSTSFRNCALHQFGVVLGSPAHYADCWSIFSTEMDEVRVLPDTASIECLPVIHAPTLGHSSTFSSLAKRLEQHLATT